MYNTIVEGTKVRGGGAEKVYNKQRRKERHLAMKNTGEAKGGSREKQNITGKNPVTKHTEAGNIFE